VLPRGRDWKQRAAEVKAALQESGVHAQKMVGLWVKAGQLLIEQKAQPEIEHGEWLPFLEAVGISEAKAERLMAIARHPVLSKSTQCRILPPHWSTLYVLSRVEPERLERLIKDGTVNPEMERSDAETLVRPKYVTVETYDLPRKVTSVQYVRDPDLPALSLSARPSQSEPEEKTEPLSSVPPQIGRPAEPEALPPPKPRFKRDRSITYETILRTVDRIVADANAEGEGLEVATARDLAEFGDDLAKRALTLQGFAPDADEEESA